MAGRPRDLTLDPTAVPGRIPAKGTQGIILRTPASPMGGRIPVDDSRRNA